MAAEAQAIKPTCDSPYEYDAVAKACKPSDAFKDLKEPNCSKNKGTLVDDKCVAPATEAMPKPTCGDARLRYKDEQCYWDDSTPRSAEGDYLGDCFTIRGVNQPIRDKGLAPLKGKDYRLVIVTGQTDIDDGKDRELSVVDASFYSKLWCLADGGAEVKKIKASDLVDAGASRRGWVYGMMAVPFKYYRSGAGSQTGNLSVGPYAGWRYARNGSGFTLAASAGLASLQGETRDSANNIIDRPQLVGYTVAAGVLWDISKRPGTRPFQLGLVLGEDRVGRSNLSKFAQHGKTWVALQLGYQFTDY